MVIVAVLLIFINNFAVSPLTNNAELMGEPLNILEPFIAVANSEILILIIPIVFLTLIADYPKVDTNTVFYIVRIGRANWFVGQILKLVFMIISYLAVIFLGGFAVCEYPPDIRGGKNGRNIVRHGVFDAAVGAGAYLA